MDKSKKRIIVLAGGTGGHIFPGITISSFLMNQGWQVLWLGTSNHMEASLVPKYGIEIKFIPISGLRGHSIKTLMLSPYHIFKAWRSAYSIIKHFRPDIALGMGGYVSGPGILAAWSLKIPIILHEQNSVAGLTNKYLSKIANKVVQAFPNTLPKANLIGNPIRKEILSILKPEIRLAGRKGKLRILIIGGSQGAFIFNKIMPKVASKIGEKIVIWHQSGKGFQKDVEKAYNIANYSQYKVTEFIDDMSTAYSWADVIICRSGALTVSEITVVGLAALFVPYQHKDKQQYLNALPLVEAGAAIIFDQSQFDVESVVNVLKGWNRSMLLKMAQSARNMAMYDATEKIAELVNLMVKNNI